MARQKQRTKTRENKPNTAKTENYRYRRPSIKHGDRVALSINRIRDVADSNAGQRRNKIYFDPDQIGANTLANLLSNRQKIIVMLLDGDLTAEVLGKAAGRCNFNVRVSVGDKTFDALFSESELAKYVDDSTDDPEAI